MKKIVFTIILSATLFSTMEVALKIAGSDFDAFQLTFLRFLIGGLFLLPFAFKRIRRKNIQIQGKDYLYLLLLGTVCIPVSMIFFQLGVENANAATAAVIFCINPMFTMLFAHFITEEKLNRNKIWALLVGLAGILFMIAPWNMAEGNTLIGTIYSTLAALLFGLYSALGRRTIHRLGGLPQTAISFLLGSLVMVPILLVLDKPLFAGITVENAGMVLYVGIMITGLGYLSYFMTMERADAATASIVFFIKPGLAPIIAVLVLREVLTFNSFLGIFLVFVGSYINLREQRLKSIRKGRSTIPHEHSRY
ncbi:MAG: DMT family transporter [Alphaproteobacteria bacterium]|nr:DMT family transporter [Alphaproteobacteria bacterium]